MVCILFVLQLQRYKIFLDFCYILQSFLYSILHFITLLQRVGNFSYLIDDYESLSVLPIEVKSGRDYTIHSALNKLLSNTDYHIKSAIVVSNERIVRQVGNVKYLPIYYIMFLDKEDMGSEEVIF